MAVSFSSAQLASLAGLAEPRSALSLFLERVLSSVRAWQQRLLVPAKASPPARAEGWSAAGWANEFARCPVIRAARAAAGWGAAERGGAPCAISVRWYSAGRA